MHICWYFRIKIKHLLSYGSPATSHWHAAKNKNDCLDQSGFNLYRGAVGWRLTPKNKGNVDQTTICRFEGILELKINPRFGSLLRYQNPLEF
jgi:beta-glucosidase/6-phospho-beta-glucosidase/beta-galactosidase